MSHHIRKLSASIVLNLAAQAVFLTISASSQPAPANPICGGGPGPSMIAPTPSVPTSLPAAAASAMTASPQVQQNILMNSPVPTTSSILPTDVTVGNLAAPLSMPSLFSQRLALRGLERCRAEDFPDWQKRAGTAKGIVIRTPRGNNLKRLSDLEYVLAEGQTAFVSVRTPSGRALIHLSSQLDVCIENGTDLLARNENGISRLQILNGSPRAVRIRLCGKLFGSDNDLVAKVAPGFEIVASPHILKNDDIRPSDGVARRHSHLLANGHASISEIAPASLLRTCPLLKEMRRERTTKQEAKALGNIVKMAAVLNFMRGTQGFASTAPDCNTQVASNAGADGQFNGPEPYRPWPEEKKNVVSGPTPADNSNGPEPYRPWPEEKKNVVSGPTPADNSNGPEPYRPWPEGKKNVISGPGDLKYDFPLFTLDGTSGRLVAGEFMTEAERTHPDFAWWPSNWSTSRSGGETAGSSNNNGQQGNAGSTKAAPWRIPFIVPGWILLERSKSLGESKVPAGGGDSSGGSRDGGSSCSGDSGGTCESKPECDPSEHPNSPSEGDQHESSGGCDREPFGLCGAGEPQCDPASHPERPKSARQRSIDEPDRLRIIGGPGTDHPGGVLGR